MIKKLSYKTLICLIDCEFKWNYLKWKNNKVITTSHKELFYEFRGLQFYFRKELIKDKTKKLKLSRRYTAALEEADFYRIADSLLDNLKADENY